VIGLAPVKNQMEEMRISVCLAALIVLLPTPLLKADIGQTDIKVLVNQAGYDADKPKRILLQADFNPAEVSSFEVLRGNELAGRGSWREAQEIDVWGLWYRTADLL
jgi:hypothetical protein